MNAEPSLSGALLGGKSGAPLKDAQDEVKLFLRRARVGLALLLLVVLLLVGRYTWLQVVSHAEYATRSNSNQVKVVPIPPNRGLIYDRRGRPVAENRSAYRLEIVPEKVRDLEATLAELARLVDLPEDALERFAESRRQYRHFDAVPLKFNLSEEEVARFAVDRHLHPGVEVVPYLSRHYPYGELLTHLLGYVGRIDVEDQARLDPGNYRGTTHVGKNGIERQYEARLHGLSGVEKVESNVEGRIIRTLERTAPLHGDDLVLAIDMQVQQAAWDALGERPGAVVAMDPRDGSVLALVSKPGFDPNAFVHGISAAGYRQILQAPGRALFNRAIQGGYEPGSTFKPFIALAGLELGVITPEHRVFSSGRYYLSGQERPYRDWREGGHGWVDLREAIEQSVNTYFYDLALKTGIDRLHDYLAQFSFGRATGLDLPGEGAGVLPSQAWKRAQFGEPWYPGETVISGIGQGFNVVTPTQLAVALTALVNGGTRFEPRLLYAAKPAGNQQAERIAAPVGGRVPMRDAENWRAVREGMRLVIHGPRGTARALLPLDGYEMGGKSGTAQVFGLGVNEKYNESEVAEHLRHHALFVAFAPVESPLIVVAAVVEHGGGGSRQAAPVARAAIDAWLQQELPR